MSSRPFWPFVGLALSLLIPSAGQVQKYAGVGGLTVYFLVTLFVVLAGYRSLLPRLVPLVTERQGLILAAGTFLGLLAVFAVVYPIANSGVVGGGTDRDEALNIAVAELLAGRYPYYVKTYLGAPITPLPGALVLALPFVLLGNSAYQNLFWLPAFFVAAWRRLNGARSALLLLWTILAFAPIVWIELVTGGDLLANGLHTLLSTLLLLAVVPDPKRSAWQKLAAAILFGLSVSSRANYVLLLPLVFSALVQNAGWRPALTSAAVVALTLAVTTVPFYLYDPAGFSPLHTAGMVAQFDRLLPRAGLVLPAVAGLLALGLAFQRMDRGGVALLRNCALPQAFLVVGGLLLGAAQNGRADFSLVGYTFAGYGLSFLFFGVLAAWMRLSPVGEQTVGSRQ